MPLYEFQCPQGHTTERRLPFQEGSPALLCECGLSASRNPINRVNQGRAPRQRVDLGSFLSADAEMKYENERLGTVPADVTGQALRRVAALRRAGATPDEVIK